MLHQIFDLAVQSRKHVHVNNCFHELLQEVYLLKRDPDSAVVEDTWHTGGPFEGNTLSMAPVWSGTWLIDVLVCIHDCEAGNSFWLKAMHRNVPADAPTR